MEKLRFLEISTYNNPAVSKAYKSLLANNLIGEQAKRFDREQRDDKLRANMRIGR